MGLSENFYSEKKFNNLSGIRDVLTDPYLNVSIFLTQRLGLYIGHFSMCSDAPIIRCPPVSAYVGEKNVRLTCEVRARPGPTALFWLIDVNGTTVTEGVVIDEYWTLVMVSKILFVFTTVGHVTPYSRCILCVEHLFLDDSGLHFFEIIRSTRQITDNYLLCRKFSAETSTHLLAL